MKKLIASVAFLVVLFGLTVLAMAANTANQTVNYEVTAIDEISVSGNPGALQVNTATAGSEPTDATDATTSWAVTTNGSGKKMIGSINTVMPPNTTLYVNLTAPAGGTSLGDVTLSTGDADLVTGISTVAESGLTITYTLSATIAAGVIPAAQKTVTLTLTDGP